ncbi:hypothetical protein SAMN05518801_101522 [Novosphingobium sp. CF614]|uniref:hypothetical protein n=1 Tax=Novosphingobium sp. CF614 TaxID=1884364 RepID=UPI0008EB5DFA|nr:hypothetical protein [Novosphingobium sp. CF614]SFF78699.1 hypothetical protein SAMN05518801_101522 [Novosphingobium sp. CF614]
MNPRFIDWIWHVRGSLALAPEQSSDDAFDRLAPLFGQTGTSHERTNDTLIFRKKDQAAQDKMAVFDGGVLRIEKGMAGSVLHYHLTSRALLFCFLAPLLFLGFAQLTIALGKLEKASTEAEDTRGKASDASKKPAKKDAELPMNPIDKALGAPAPEKPEKEGADKAKDQDKKHSPTSAYVFAAIFAALYVVGRILEDRLVKALFRKSLLGS